MAILSDLLPVYQQAWAARSNNHESLRLLSEKSKATREANRRRLKASAGENLTPALMAPKRRQDNVAERIERREHAKKSGFID